jgi:hypothetical protein
MQIYHKKGIDANIFIILTNILKVSLLSLKLFKIAFSEVKSENIFYTILFLGFTQINSTY